MTPTLDVTPTLTPAGPIARWWSLIAFALRVALAVVFLLAAWVKLQNMLVPGSIADVGVPGPVNFRDAILAYPISAALPEWMVSWATYVIPFTELLVAVCLIIGLWSRAAALIYILLMATFVVGIVHAINTGKGGMTCGCFGDLRFFCEGQVDWCKVRENATFAAGAALIVVLGPGRMAMDWVVRRG